MEIVPTNFFLFLRKIPHLAIMKLPGNPWVMGRRASEALVLSLGK